ncbi:ARM repeat-containing protein [Amylocystis lapponica]|nr:ARM repeat-containing protein [Amylocystis lapponica]
MPAMTKVSKKRPAPSQGGPKAKKAHIEKSGAKSAAAAPEKGKHRSRPVTAPINDEHGSTSDESAGEDLADGEDHVDEEAEDGPVDTGAAQAKDPNAAREAHKVQRALFDQRRAAKPHSDLLVDAKQAWTLARQKTLSKEERTKHIGALMDIIRGKVKDIVFKHDASRIVQTVVKHGREKERNEVAAELQGKYRELAQSKYSKFLITKLIRLCPAHRPAILREFQGHVLRLLLHREASSVLADAFELYTNAYERSLLLRDFYGKEASLVTVTAGSEHDKERSKKGLKGLLEGVEGERRKRILGALKDNLVMIFNNPDKGAVSHAIVHRAMWEYLIAVNELESVEEQEKLRREMFESCQDVLAEMVHTKDGSRVVREFIAQGTAKDRKHIVKALKPHVARICKDDEAQLVLFTALDVIDDTKLTAKSLVADVTASASSLYTTSQGRRSIIYLVAPRTRRHFTPAMIATLEDTDAIRARTSKKESALRAEEIARAASAELLAWVAKTGAEAARDPGGSLVVCEIMLGAIGDKSAASEALLAALAAAYPAPELHPAALPHTSRLYKTLLNGGHFSAAARAVECAPHFDARAFAEQFVRVVGREATLVMARGEGAFVVVALCERLAEADGESEARKVVRGWFDASVREEIERADVRGKAVLLEKIRALG